MDGKGTFLRVTAAKCYLLCHGPGENVVSSTLLIRSNEFWDVDGWPGFQAAHVWLELLL